MIKTKSGIGLSAFTLKIIAIASMLSSHIAIMFPDDIPKKFLLPMVLFGRLAFPIFAFFIANGWERTRSKWKYALRLFVMAVFSQIPFLVGIHDVAWTGLSTVTSFTTLNIGFTFLLAMFSLLVYDFLRDMKLPKLLSIALALVPALAFEFLTPLHVEYGYIGIFLVLVMYVTKTDTLSFALSSIATLALMVGRIDLPVFSVNLYLLATYIVSVGLLLLYNGRRGTRAKYLFYIFYPLHIIVLLLIKNIVF